jgi:hypothetical protein
MQTMKRMYLFTAAITGVAMMSLTGPNLQAQGPPNGQPRGSSPVYVVNPDENPVPVRVLNPDPNPGPVRGTDRTISVVTDRSTGPSGSELTLKTPACPTGTEFLVSALNVSSSISTDDTWEVRVRLEQRYAVGPGAPADLVVVGHGRAHTSQVLPAGQPTQGPGEVTVKFIQAGGARLGFYTAHISGYCGVPYVMPGEFVGPGDRGGPLPGGWDLEENGGK